MKRLLISWICLGSLAAMAGGPGYGPQDLYTQARWMKQLTEVFEDQVDRRFRRSPVNKWADRLADRADDFLDEVEDGDIREMQEEYQEMGRAYVNVARAYAQCPMVPRDPHLSALWRQIGQLYQSMGAQLRGGHHRRGHGYRQPYPRHPGYGQQPYPGHRNPGYGQQPYPQPGYGNSRVDPRRLQRQPAQYGPNPGRRDPRFPW